MHVNTRRKGGETLAHTQSISISYNNVSRSKFGEKLMEKLQRRVVRNGQRGLFRIEGYYWRKGECRKGTPDPYKV
jgi:hypothetical protein